MGGVGWHRSDDEEEEIICSMDCFCYFQREREVGVVYGEGM